MAGMPRASTSPFDRSDRIVIGGSAAGVVLAGLTRHLGGGPVPVFARSASAVTLLAPLPLVFTPMLVVSVAIAVPVTAFITADGEFNWIDGAAMIAVYAIIATAF